MIKTCPNCKQLSFEPQQQHEDMVLVLKRWEAETAARFQPETWAEYTKNGETTFYKCSECNFGAFDPACAGTANFYNDITIEGNYYVGEKWEFLKTYKIIKQKNVKSLLDYGCGGGAFLRGALERFSGVALDGFDKNPQAEQSFVDTNIGFTNDLSAHNGKTYDMITAFQILEHLEDPFTTLKDIKKSLKNGGTLIVSVPNTDGPIRHFPKSLTEIPPHHVSRFNKKSLEVYLKNEGFQILDIAYEPLSKILWPCYLPVMIYQALPRFLQRVYSSLRGPKFIQIFVLALNKLGIKNLPIKGHSIYVVAQKCVE